MRLKRNLALLIIMLLIISSIVGTLVNVNASDEAITKTETIADINFDDSSIIDGTVKGITNSITGMNTDGTYPFEISDGHLAIGDGTGTISVPTNQLAGPSDIVHATFKMSFGKLGGKKTSFYFKDSLGNNVGYLEMETYNSLFSTNLENTSGELTSMIKAAVMVPSWEDSKIITFDLTFNYKEGTITTIISNSNDEKTATVNMVNINPISSFSIVSNYNNNDRKTLMDDLKIERTFTGYSVQFDKLVDGSTIKVDDAEFTNGSIVAIGTHKYEISCENYATKSGSFYVSDKNITIDASLEEIKQATELTINYIYNNSVIKTEKKTLSNETVNSEYTYYYPAYIQDNDGKYYKNIIKNQGYSNTVILGNGETISEVSCEPSNTIFYSEISNGSGSYNKKSGPEYSEGEAFSTQRDKVNQIKFETTEDLASYKIYLPLGNDNSFARSIRINVDGNLLEEVSVASNKKVAFYKDVNLEKGEHTLTLSLVNSLTPILDYVEITKNSNLNKVEVSQNIENGSIVIDNAPTYNNEIYLGKGEKVTFSATTSEGYTLVRPIVKTDDLTDIDVTFDANTNKYSFDMPERPVSISMLIVKKPEYSMPSDAISSTQIANDIVKENVNKDIEGRNDYGAGYTFINRADFYLDDSGIVKYYPAVGNAVGTEIVMSTEEISYTDSKTTVTINSDGLTAGQWYTVEMVTNLSSILMDKQWDDNRLINLKISDSQGNVVASAANIKYRNQSYGINAIKYEISNSLIANAYSYFVQTDFKLQTSIISNAGGTITFLKDNNEVSTAHYNDEITIKTTLNEGFNLKSLVVKNANNEEISLTEDNKFSMPAQDVTVSAEFETSTPDTYIISISTQIENGTVVADKASAKVDDEITLTPKPAIGYKIKSLKVINANNQNEIVTLKENYKFAMPAYDVVVIAEFEKEDYSITKNITGNGTVQVMQNNAEVSKAQIGDVITVKIKPSEGFSLSSIDLKGATLSDQKKDTDGSYIYTFTMKNENVSLNVSFSKDAFNIKIGNIVNGTLKTDKQSASYGEEVTITVNPNAGYKVTSIVVKDNKGQNVAVTSGKFKMPASEVTVSAEFEAIVYSINVEKTANGVVTYEGTGTVGQTISVTATPNANYEVESIIVKDSSGKQISVSNSKFTMPASNITITVNFKLITKKITTASVANGSITLSTDKAAQGEEVTVTLAPNNGYKLKDGSLMVTDENSNSVSISKKSDKVYTFIMPSSNVSVSAMFVGIDHTITLGDKRISSDKQSAKTGEDVTITIVPDDGYKVSKLNITNVNVDISKLSNNKYTFTMPASDVKITVEFSKIDYEISVTKSNYGKVDVVKAGVPGDKIQVTVTPNMGYKLSQIKIIDSNKKEIELTDNAFIMPDSKVTITTAFEPIQFKFSKVDSSTYDNSNGSLTFVLDGNLELFKAVYINGVELDSKNYTLASGSTIITLKDEYLKTLDNGEYTLKVEYTTGVSDSTEFTVTNSTTKGSAISNINSSTKEEKTNKSTTPVTGDILNIAIVLFVLIFAGNIIYVKSKKNKRKFMRK